MMKNTIVRGRSMLVPKAMTSKADDSGGKQKTQMSKVGTYHDDTFKENGSIQILLHSRLPHGGWCRELHGGCSEWMSPLQAILGR